MDKSVLVRLFGFPATLLHGDTLVLDRWLWLRPRLRKIPPARIIDVGCGSGAFSIGAARLGHQPLGLSWDERNQAVATLRARLCGQAAVSFEVIDIRRLDEHPRLHNKFEAAICCEVIEHVLNDRKLLADIARCLIPGGRLFLTTPFVGYRSITREDDGPFRPVEDGGHVRKGYSPADLEALCAEAGLSLVEVSSCSGLFSQKITAVLRHATRIHPVLGWLLVAPLRWVPPLLDPVAARLLGWPDFSLCIVAQKPAT